MYPGTPFENNDGDRGLQDQTMEATGVHKRALQHRMATLIGAPITQLPSIINLQQFEF